MTKAKRCYLKQLAVLIIFTSTIALRAQASEEVGGGDVRFTYDLSASMGSSGGSNYTEIALGLNTFFANWFVWRNAGFSRMGTGYDGTYGLDTSARFQFDFGDEGFGLHTFAGPGYRFVVSQNQDSGVSRRSESAPFVEAGAIAKLGGIRIGAGVKTILNKLLDADKQDETQYFLILSGGGSL